MLKEIEVSMEKKLNEGIYILTNEETLSPSLICSHIQGILLICLLDCFKVFILVSKRKKEKQIADSRTFTTFSQFVKATQGTAHYHASSKPVELVIINSIAWRIRIQCSY